MSARPDLEFLFRDHVLGDGPVPAALAAALRPGPAADVLSIHRNNYRLGLAGALADTFPAVEALVGEDCFAGLAAAFARAHPPRSPVLSTYGADFPAFLNDCETVAALPYLGDVARLDWAWNGALHAADAAPATPASLAAALAVGGDVDLRPHPSLRPVALERGVFDLWRFARAPETFPDRVDIAPGPQFAVLVRPDLEVTAMAVDAGTHALLAALAAGAGLADALARTAPAAPPFNPEESLARLVALGAFTLAPTNLEDPTHD